MFQPDPSDVHVDHMLTNISIAVVNDPSNYISMQVYPKVEVSKQSDIIPKYDEADWLADEAQPRAPATESAGSGWDVTKTMTYYAKNYAHHKDNPFELVANTDAPFNLDEEATMWVTDKLLMKTEVNFAADHFATGKWTTEVDLAASGKTKWSATGSTPFKDIETAKQAVGDLIAHEPSVMVVGRAVHGALLQHADVLDRIKYTQPGIVTTVLLKALFELDKYLVGRAIRNTAKEGQTKSVSRVLGKHALLVFVTPRPSLMSPSAGYTLFWDALGPGRPVFIRRLDMPLTMATRIEGHTFFDMKQTSADAGYMILNAAA